MKFDCVIMNPPWGGPNNVGLAEKILYKAFECSKQITSLMPETPLKRCGALNKKTAIRREHFKYCDEADIFSVNYFPEISARTNFTIAHFDLERKLNRIKINDFSKRDLSKIKNIEDLTYKHYDLKQWLNKVSDIKDKLIRKYGAMANRQNKYENGLWEYFEGKAKEGHRVSDAKKLLADGAYKYMLTRTAFEHFTDPIYESFKSKSPCTWLMNKKNIQQNMKYWLSDKCKFIFILRKSIIAGEASSFAYSKIPAANFDMPEDEFKRWANNLYKFEDCQFEDLKKKARL